MVDLESLFKLSYGMCIVCSEKDGSINGCIVNTVFQIVPEPPMLAISLNKQSLTHDYIVHSGFFTISVLSQETPMPFIGKFGFRTGRGIDKFQDVNYTTSVTGVPIVRDNTIAFIEVELSESLDIETHTLFIGKVLACEIINDSALPLRYSYYRDIKHGRTPETAATYHQAKQKQDKETRQ